ncbi:MAG: hypothetical protein PHU25_04710 [Deltaproteobacteria bacterium]|nr:hypothetical protein [Deltaproteobacteria bacterium]
MSSKGKLRGLLHRGPKALYSRGHEGHGNDVLLRAERFEGQALRAVERTSVLGSPRERACAKRIVAAPLVGAVQR